MDHTQSYVKLFSAMHRTGQPMTDIDETPMGLQVRCTKCKEVHTEHIIAESLGDYIPNDDGTYSTLLGECAACLSQFCEHQQYRSLCPECSPLR